MSYRYASGLNFIISHHLPREHYATAVAFVRDHPLYAWWQRNIWRRRNYAGGFFIRGAPLTRCPGQGFRYGNDFVVSPEMYEQIKRQIGA